MKRLGLALGSLGLGLLSGCASLPDLQLAKQAKSEGDLATAEALDQVRPILSRLRMLVTLAEDTEMALGSDLYKAALEGYRFARAGGKGAMLDELKAQANPRFGNQGRRRKPSNGTGTGDPA